MTDLEIYEMLDRMDNYGGSFVVALANAIRLADFKNKGKLIAAFPEYVETYGPTSKFSLSYS